MTCISIPSIDWNTKMKQNGTSPVKGHQCWHRMLPGTCWETRESHWWRWARGTLHTPLKSGKQHKRDSWSLIYFKCNDAGKQQKLEKLEADFASGHGVAQFGFVVDEGHDAQIGLDEQRPLQQQHPVRPARDGELFMGSLYRLDQLNFKVLQLKNKTGRSL